MILLTVLYFYIVRFGFKLEDGKITGDKEKASRQLKELGPLKGG